MRNYLVTKQDGRQATVMASSCSAMGIGCVQFYRKHPSAPQEGTPYDPEAPYFEPLFVAMFNNVESVELIEEE